MRTRSLCADGISGFELSTARASWIASRDPALLEQRAGERVMECGVPRVRQQTGTAALFCFVIARQRPQQERQTVPGVGEFRAQPHRAPVALDCPGQVTGCGEDGREIRLRFRRFGRPLCRPAQVSKAFLRFALGEERCREQLQGIHVVRLAGQHGARYLGNLPMAPKTLQRECLSDPRGPGFFRATRRLAAD